MSIGHFVRVYALVVGDGDVERMAADAFLAAETRKVNAKWVTNTKNCCIKKALAEIAAGNRRGLHRSQAFLGVRRSGYQFEA